MKTEFKSWPFKEAVKVAGLLERKGWADDKPVIFETGFGPSGLPHIGTFAEVARTTWVMNAFAEITGRKAELFAFSDDMDGLRKVPLNLPEKEMLEAHLGKPLSSIPDPFRCCDSFSAHMNNKLKDFLDSHGFDYNLVSSRDAYRRGDFNDGLAILMDHLDDVRGVILPTLGEDKRENWYPFFPICESCGGVNTTRVVECNRDKYSVSYRCDREHGCGSEGEVSIFDGGVKAGWKVDWALRWFSYDIAYEMYGKDLIESAKLSSKIIRIMGKQPPQGFFYEMFLDETGKKISKKVGRGLTVDTWMDYAPVESLLYYIFQNPRKAKRLYWELVPRVVDDYLESLRNWPKVPSGKRPDSVLWHIFERGTKVPDYEADVDYSMVHNLLSAVGAAASEEIILEYLEAYDHKVAEYKDFVRTLVDKSLKYYRDFILPGKRYKTPNAEEKQILREMRNAAAAVEDWEDERTLQGVPFYIAEKFDIAAPEVFRLFYEVMLGQERGPRFGSFARLAGKERLLNLFDEKLRGKVGN